MRSPCGGLGCANNGLATGCAVDHAADARAAAHLVDAGVAGEAAPDRLTARELLDPLRIGDQRAAERNEIGLAFGDRRGRDHRIAEAADRDHRYVDHRLHLGGEVEKRRVRHVHRRQDDLRRRHRAVVPGGDVQRVGAGLGGPQRDLFAFVEGQSADEEVLDRQAVDHAKPRHCGLHGAQHVEPEAGAVLQAAAVFVGAAVFERRMELRDQVAVRGVDLDAVEAGLLRAHRGGDVCGGRLRDARLAHFFRDDGLERGLVDRMRDSGRRDRGLAADVLAGVAAAVAELDRGFRAAAMDLVDKTGEPGQEAVVIDADLVPSVAAAFLR